MYVFMYVCVYVCNICMCVGTWVHMFFMQIQKYV